MEYYSAPEHIASPQSDLTYRYHLGILWLIAGFIGWLLINDSKIFIGIAFFIICFSIMGYNFFGFKRCSSCDHIMIPKSKKYCYDCWQRAKQANDPELNKDILNPED